MHVKAGILLLILVLLAASCNSEPQINYDLSYTAVPPRPLTTPSLESQGVTQTPAPTTEPETGPDARELLAQAMVMMDEAGTFHFAMDRRVTNKAKSSVTAVHIPVSGRYHAPDLVRGIMSHSMFTETGTVEFISIGGTIYLREHLGGDWRIADEHSPAAQVIRENAFLPLAQFAPESLTNPVLVGEVLLHDTPVYHVHVAGSQHLAKGRLSAVANATDFWIGKEDHCIYRIISELTAADSDETTTSGLSQIQIDYSNFEEPVLIVAPLLEDPAQSGPT